MVQAFIYVILLCFKMSAHQTNKDKPRSSKCRHFCFAFDTHNYCPTCRESGKGDDPCVTFENHPTHWPTLRNVLSYLKKPVSECGSRKPPNGHVTTPIGAIHCFCWPSLSVDVFWKYSFFVEVLWIYCGLCLF